MSTLIFVLIAFILFMLLMSVGILFSKKTRLRGSCKGEHKHLVAADGTPLTCDHCTCEHKHDHHPQ